MTTSAQLMTELGARVARHGPAVEHIGATLKFELLGETSPTPSSGVEGDKEIWLVRLEPPPSVRLISGNDDNDEADGHFRLSRADFVALMTGKLTGQQLFFEGRLEVEGDLTLALKLRELTQILKG